VRAASNPAADLLEPGALLGRYTVLGLVGRGGMGQVYAAYDPQLDRRIALKLMVTEAGEDDGLAHERLMREAQSMARLTHPNVVTVHDVGVVDARVFLAMEFVAGSTLAQWTQGKTHPWREVLGVYLQAGRGLAAAHGAGLVHRDFKPQNAMIDRQGNVRVMDFGLARDAESAQAVERERPVPPELLATTPARLDLTRPGERLGTPRYMAPEQFEGRPADARSDQFSFCVALYEALYGGHPFDDDSYLALSLSVTNGELRAPPKDRDVPGWLRRVVVRGLRRRPEERHATMAALVAALEDDPAVARRRRLVAAGVIAFAVSTVLVARQMITRRGAELDRRVAEALAAAGESATRARAGAGRLRQARAEAFAAFDAGEWDRGEAVWRKAVPLGPKVEALYTQAERAFETALLLDAARPEARERAADLTLEHFELAEELGAAGRARELTEQLAPLDPRGTHLAVARAPGTLVLSVRPAAATIALERYETDPETERRTPAPTTAPVRGETSLPPGSYRLVLGGPGLAQVHAPFVVARGQRAVVDVDVPRADAVPAGFVFVPAGTFLFGDADERLRRGFLDAAPMHQRSAGSFLIARRETTYREWIEFLDGLPPAERKRHAPHLGSAYRGTLDLVETPRGWQLSIREGPAKYSAHAGERIEYTGRGTLASQDWLDFPVGGISAIDAERYLAWLSASGHLAGARFCSEVEWERAARGADDRIYPHGDGLEPTDANYCDTYGRVDSAYGPDAVGSHPRSRSPFDVDDLVGNVFELVTSDRRRDEMLMRGGAFIFDVPTCRSTNRTAMPRTFQEVILGLRVCATPPGASAAGR
jgi:formylglycine-generating enzyme required for sulfatase activity